MNVLLMSDIIGLHSRQAGHFGLAPFDPVGLTTDYNRQAEVPFPPPTRAALEYAYH